MNAFPISPRAVQRLLVGCVATACIATITVTAQEPQPGVKPTQPDHSYGSTPKVTKGSGDYTSTDTIVGAKVKLTPSLEARNEAAREGEKADAPTAKAVDWLVDCTNGSVQYAVISIGGFLGIGDKTVLVPANDLVWDPTSESFQLNWTKDQLEQRTPFDLSKACETGLDAAARSAGGAKPMPGTGTTTDEHGRPVDPSGRAPVDANGKPVGGTTVDASGKSTKTIPGTTYVEPMSKLCKASTLGSLPVEAGNEKFGTVEDLIIDRSKHEIVLAVVGHGGTLGVGGTDVLVPYKKLTPCTKSGSTGDLAALCAVNTTKDDLAKSVVYEKPKDGIVDPAAAKRALDPASDRGGR